MKLRILSREDFPELLKEIPDPPEKLYLEGEPIPEDSIRIAVVGSRKYTDYGKRVTERLIRDLAKYNVTIVSGCALGIDSIAHQAAIKNQMYTIGIPGSGLDKSAFYPRSNYFLKESILKSGGTLVSEFEPKEKAARWMFPKRNRIMAGMSHAILVIEATPKSGTLITARLGLEYNREVFAVPGQIFAESSEGANLLIQTGASTVLSAEDIVNELHLEERTLFRDNLFNSGSTDGSQSKDPEASALSLFKDSISRDEFVSLIGDTKEAQVLITKLEIQGRVTTRGNNIYKN